MAAFDSLRIAGSSMGMHQTWLDALSHNIANVNTVRRTDQTAFQAQLVVADARADGGVSVRGLELSDPAGRLVQNPSHPLADADGNVRMPDADLGAQLTELVVAQRGFQAAVSVTKTAQDTYASALQIGRRS
ncbi:MAG: hypothetical protein WCF36_13610 [Candidatus Nanopelagicales bacterium]